MQTYTTGYCHKAPSDSRYDDTNNDKADKCIQVYAIRSKIGPGLKLLPSAKYEQAHAPHLNVHRHSPRQQTDFHLKHVVAVAAEHQDICHRLRLFFQRQLIQPCVTCDNQANKIGKILTDKDIYDYHLKCRPASMMLGILPPDALKHWISDRTLALLKSQRNIPAGPESNPLRRIIGRQAKVSVRVDREVWWTQNAEEMEGGQKAGNARRLFQFIRATGPRKPPVSETIKHQNETTISKKLEGFDRTEVMFHDIVNARTRLRLYAYIGSQFWESEDIQFVHISVGRDSAKAHVTHGENGPAATKRIDAKRDLGIWLSSKISFLLHHEKSARKAFAVPRMTQRTFSRITRMDFQILYGSYVKPPLVYAN
ncbi:ATP-binding cassette transporter [Clonorchis sinensis]|uniref:ATP-binding cassette transporter n=1 Tax=Clonorchis sinensis TaxID=79923 RepID=G7YVQ6_CLOSI|nr:ATP-binding cassette transporter [Clonorchis sinensis]